MPDWWPDWLPLLDASGISTWATDHPFLFTALLWLIISQGAQTIRSVFGRAPVIQRVVVREGDQQGRQEEEAPEEPASALSRMHRQVNESLQQLRERREASERERERQNAPTAWDRMNDD